MGDFAKRCIYGKIDVIKMEDYFDKNLARRIKEQYYICTTIS